MNIFFICVIIASLIATFGILITFRLWRIDRHNLKRPTISGSITLVLAAIVIVAGYIIQPKPCTQAQVSHSSGPPSCAAGSIKIDGSTALQPFVQAVADSYTPQCPGAFITVGGSKSLQGVQEVADDQIAIADSDVFAPSDVTGVMDHQVVVTVFAVIVNGRVGISNLTADDLQKIYNGTVTNWKDIGGPDLSITAYRRSEGSGTRITFEQYVLPKHTESITKPDTIEDPAKLVDDVKNNVGAIGYISYYDAHRYSAESLIISIDGTTPTRNLSAIVSDNTYQFWSVEHMYTKGQASGLAQAFIDYMGNDQVSEIAKSLSFVSINQINANVLAGHCST